MFTPHSSHFGKPVGSAAASVVKRVGASVGICALTVGFALAGPGAASAATLPASYGEGQFLSGTLLGLDLNSIVELTPAFASNNGSQPMQSSSDPLSVTALNTIGVNSGNAAHLRLGDVLDARILHQFAQAAKDGSSMATSGAIGKGDDIDLHLNSLLNGTYAPVLSDLKLSLDAVAAEARASLTTASGDYTLAEATLSFTSPAIAQLSPKVNTALLPVDAAIASLSGNDGILGNAVDRVVDPVLGAIGSSANVSAVVTADVHGAVQPLLTGTYGNGGVTFNLQTGEVSVDLAQFSGGKLNDLAPGTELLSGPVVNQILNGITDTVSTLTDQIAEKVTVALRGAQVTVHADLDMLSPQRSLDSQICRDIQVPIIGDIVTPITGGVLGGLGGLLGGTTGTTGGTTVTQGVIGYTTKTVCDVVSKALPDLRSTVNVDIKGTVQQILGGTAATAAASVSLLGGTVSAKIDADLILDGLAAGLNDSLFDSDGAVAQVVDRLNAGLLNPAVDGLLGSKGVGTVLTSVISVKVNLQELTRGAHGSKDAMFTQTAVRVTVLGGAGSSKGATVNLAQASVGPNVTRIVDSCATNCTPGASNPDPNCTSNCNGGGLGTSVPTEINGNGAGAGAPITSATNRLAYTGVGIATLIAVILALLAAGAYLAREGYRRNHAKSVATD
ncbi:choice-of-anchor G family protein [Salinibacterium sp. G-O1]|uniref:choice-of-anchor G family protein n=1 Tax=Salinibacterium sp. G-O1 TaxID=3046208 RepID=UPI0024BBE0E7|nr:choice-of-anchor G family protein [Salinibacterium sp. G-O1]MDJ0334290.1 choice-of-anchor G family protein [Salinibacterium sp. G-O1]